MNRSGGTSIGKYVFIALWGAMSAVGSLDGIKADLNEYDTGLSPRRRRWSVLSEPLNFSSQSTNATYRRFAASVSNEWRQVLLNLPLVATNNSQRLYVFGVAKQYDEDFFIDFINEMAQMRTNSMVTAFELEWTYANTRTDLGTCMIRRYQEPKIIQTVNLLKLAMPISNYWDEVLSGVAYSNYLDRVSAGYID